MKRVLLWVLVVATSAACGGDDDGPDRDAGGVDAARDSGATDSGATDSGATDSGATDSGATDSGATDSGATDSGATDSGATDGGATDGGATCVANGDCDRSQYCAGPSCDGPGECLPRPRLCPDVYMPVCGCDGMTYSNSCHAAAAGVRVASEGACGDDCAFGPPSRGCCFDDLDCADGTVCRGEVCAPRGAGTCVAPPRAGSCWDDTDCGRGEVCSGHSRCPCGAMCFVRDRPGTCVPDGP